MGSSRSGWKSERLFVEPFCIRLCGRIFIPPYTRNPESRAGLEEVRIAPDVNCGLEYAKGSYDSIWGRISVEWKKTADGVDLKIELPPDVELVEIEE